jgi:carboxymethylenebutenolidase
MLTTITLEEVTMKKALVIVILLMLASVSAYGQSTEIQRLENSPRHHEWVAVTYGDRTVHSFLVFPEVRDKALAVVVIHENRGLTDWVRSVADQLAEAGYIAIAPDLLSGMGPQGGKTSDFPNSDAAREAIYKLPPEQVTADLNAVADHVSRLPASNERVAVAGFCWGGAQSFRFATNRQDLLAAFVFYGTGPKMRQDISRIKCPVFGFYGSNDARVNATLSETTDLMKEAGKTFEPVIYDGAGHAFMRLGEASDGTEANKQARQEAWDRWKSLLKKIQG